MSHEYSTALSHIILAGTGIWCLRSYGTGGNFALPHATYGIIITNSLLGIWRWGNPDHGEKVERPYNFTYFLQTIFALPCIAADVWLAYKYQTEVGYAHVCVSLIPLLQYLSDRSRGDLIDLILTANAVSLGVVGFLETNYYAIAAAVAFAFNHFCLNDESDIFGLPPRDMYNYGMCFFTYFSLRALTN